MKKNRSMRIGVIVLALTLITACLAGNTFAKYTSTVNGTGNASIATWAWKINDTDSTADFDVNLVETSVAANEYGSDVADTDVATGKIAPGTQGSFNVVIENNSEVSGNYSMTFTVPENSPVEIKIGEGTWGATATKTENIPYTVAADDNTKTITVMWRWAFEGANPTTDDVADTALEGTAFAIAITGTFTQVD